MISVLNNAKRDSQKLQSNLQDLQTILRIFSMCTANKVTHLFGCDVYNTPIQNLPSNFYLWDSDLTSQFSDMTNDILANTTNTLTLPTYSHIIAHMTINQGGLGIQHPRSHAITSYMTTTKRCLQYAHCGVWLGFNKPRPFLPPHITSLYLDWESSNNRTWQIFRKYLPTFNSIAFEHPDSDHDFIFKASLNGSREKAKQFSSKQIQSKVLLNDLVTPAHVKQVLPGLLCPHTSMALMTMSRTNEHHRLNNSTFSTALKRKLRLPLFHDITNYKCKCGAKLDEYGDHSLGCRVNHKTKASNGIRDGLVKIFQRVLTTAKMIDSPTQVEREIHNIVPSLPRLQPFDLSIRLDHSLDTGAWKVPFKRIGFDVVLIHSTKSSSATSLEAAQYTECDLRLRDGERMKFVRRTGGTNEITNKSLSADQVIGEIIDDNNTFIPVAIGPFGEIGSLFRRFLTNTSALPPPTIPPDRPNAIRAATLANHHKTPHDVLGKATRIWQKQHSDTMYDGNYMAPSPYTWAMQQLGLTVTTHICNHINASLTKLTYGRTQLSRNSHGDGYSSDQSDGIDRDWNFYDGIDQNFNYDSDHDTYPYIGTVGIDPTSITGCDRTR